MRSSIVAGVVVLASALVPASAQAQAPFEIAREPVEGLDVASASTGRALTTWWGTGGLAARPLGLSGPLGPRRALGPTPSRAAAVAADTRLGRYLTVYSDWVEGEGAHAYAQVLDAAGAPVGARRPLFNYEFGGIEPQAVVYNPRTRQYLVLLMWSDDAPGALGALRLDENGVPLGTGPVAIPVSQVTSADAAVRPVSGGYLVTWADGYDSSVIRGQRLDSSGGLAGSAFLVSQHANLAGAVDNRRPSIAVDPATDEGMIVWTDQFEAFGRRFSAAGIPVGGDLRFSNMGPATDPAWPTRSPDVAFGTASRQFLVAWQSGPGRDAYPAGEVVYGQLVSRTGAEVGTNDFALATVDRATDPAVTATPGGDFLAVWTSRRASPSAWARRVAPAR